MPRPAAREPEEVYGHEDREGCAEGGQDHEGRRAEGRQGRAREGCQARRHEGRRREAERLLEAGSLTLLYIEGNKPRTARRELEEILSNLSGTVRICDPYYGVRSLEALELVPANCTVRFLTARTNENPTRLSGHLRDFKRERPNTELRLYPNARELHDRYILSRDRVLIVGHGLKDIGGRESFVIAIQEALAPNLLAQVSAAFDDKWVRATAL